MAAEQIRVEEVPAIAIIRASLRKISEEIKVEEAGQDFDSGDYFVRLFTVEFPGLNQTMGMAVALINRLHFTRR